MIIEIFKDFENKIWCHNLQIEEYSYGDYRIFYLLRYCLHKDKWQKNLFQYSEIEDLLDYHGFYIDDEIDCSNRSQDRYDTIIYHYCYFFTPDRISTEDNNFIKEYLSKPYDLLTVFKKYNINDDDCYEKSYINC